MLSSSYATAFVSKIFPNLLLLLPLLKHTPFPQHFVLSWDISSILLCILCNLSFPRPHKLIEWKSQGGTVMIKMVINRLVLAPVCTLMKARIFLLYLPSQTLVSSHPCSLGCVSSTLLFLWHESAIMLSLLFVCDAVPSPIIQYQARPRYSIRPHMGQAMPLLSITLLKWDHLFPPRLYFLKVIPLSLMFLISDKTYCMMTHVFLLLNVPPPLSPCL